MSDMHIPTSSQNLTKSLVITPFMPKGGVGKTTSAAHFGYALAFHGKTLLVDADPQGNLTHHLLTIDEFQSENKTLLQYLIRIKSFADSLIEARKPDPDKNFKGLYLLGTETNSDTLQEYIQGKFQNNPRQLNLLVKEASRNGFEYIIFDPPAFFGLYTRTILSISTNVIPIVELEEFGFASLFTLVDDLNEIKEGYDAEFDYSMAIINKYNKKIAVHAHFLKQMEESPFKPLFVISNTNSIPYSSAQSRLLQEYMVRNPLNAVFAGIAAYFSQKKELYNG
jgi:chromosome partitioning protein